MDKGHNFLYNHPMTEKNLGLDEQHVIVDRDAWEEARKQVLNLSIPRVTNWAFNLNQNIRVKLLDKGYQRLADLHNEFIGRIPNWQKRDAKYYKQQADQDGYTSFQAWTFMEYFGEATRIEMHEYYSTEILVAAKDITPCL